MTLKFEGFMAFRAGYIYSLHMSAEFQKLSSTLNSTPFSEQEWLDLIEVVELGAVDIERLREIRNDWGSRYVLPRDGPVFREVLERSKVPEPFKRELGSALDELVRVSSAGTDPTDRLGMIAGNIFFLQDFTRAQNAQVFNLNFLTHFKKEKRVLELSRGSLGRGISFGLAREGDVGFCSFKTLHVHDDAEFIALENTLEFALVREYVRLHGSAFDGWDHVVNSVPVKGSFQNRVLNLMGTRSSASAFPAFVAPVLYYGTVVLPDGTVSLGADSGGVLVENRDLLEKVEQFHLVDLLEYLRAVFTSFLDPALINSDETMAFVPVGFGGDLYLVVEYNRALDKGSAPQRLGVVYRVYVVPEAPGTISKICSYHCAILPGLLVDVTSKLSSTANGGEVDPASLGWAESLVSSRVRAALKDWGFLQGD
ncbi:MAG: hypothetical protein ACTSU5_12370 [Promethearchaeota archaeon]